MRRSAAWRQGDANLLREGGSSADSLLGLGGVLHQLLVVLGLAPADPGQGDSPTPFDPAALQQQLDSLQEQLRALQQGPGGGDGDGVTLLDPGNLGGLLNGDGG
ncbi:MAG TPA: hypothetical protein VMZ00_15840, partial [Sporichthya sp.]|nr:hypothetical protein [Sporichthya sp.]